MVCETPARRCAARMPDAIVIGGGVVGAACAYEVARRGSTVVLVERDELAAASSRNQGWFVLSERRRRRWVHHLLLHPEPRSSAHGIIASQLLRSQTSETISSTMARCGEVHSRLTVSVFLEGGFDDRSRYRR